MVSIDLEPHEQATIDHGILVTNKERAPYFWPPSGSVMIRIGDKGDFPPLLHPTRYNIIQEMNFGDYTSLEEYQDYKAAGILDISPPISASQGKALATMIMGIKPEEFLVVHCYAGISRSSAIGVAFARWRKDLVLESILFTGYYHPNILVLSSIVRYFPGAYQDEE